jgi:hypothetical protein
MLIVINDSTPGAEFTETTPRKITRERDEPLVDFINRVSDYASKELGVEAPEYAVRGGLTLGTVGELKELAASHRELMQVAEQFMVKLNAEERADSLIYRQVFETVKKGKRCGKWDVV